MLPDPASSIGIRINGDRAAMRRLRGRLQQLEQEREAIQSQGEYGAEEEEEEEDLWHLRGEEPRPTDARPRSRNYFSHQTFFNIWYSIYLKFQAPPADISVVLLRRPFSPAGGIPGLLRREDEGVILHGSLQRQRRKREEEGGVPGWGGGGGGARGGRPRMEKS